MDMETILEETVATEDLKKFEQKYHTELNDGKVGVRLRFIWTSNIRPSVDKTNSMLNPSIYGPKSSKFLPKPFQPF